MDHAAYKPASGAAGSLEFDRRNVTRLLRDASERPMLESTIDNGVFERRDILAFVISSFGICDLFCYATVVDISSAVGERTASKVVPTGDSRNDR